MKSRIKRYQAIPNYEARDGDWKWLVHDFHLRAIIAAKSRTEAERIARVLNQAERKKA